MVSDHGPWISSPLIVNQVKFFMSLCALIFRGVFLNVLTKKHLVLFTPSNTLFDPTVLSHEKFIGTLTCLPGD